MGIFKNFLNHILNEVVVDCPNGIFAKVLPTTDSILKIKSRFSQFSNLKDDLHCTAIFSKTPAKSIDLPAIDKNERYKAIGKEVVWWEGHDKEGYLVLKLDSPELKALNKRFVDSGLVPTFAEYNPHVTLLNPCEEQMSWVNTYLIQNPLHLDFYYGGYTIMDPK